MWICDTSSINESAFINAYFFKEMGSWVPRILVTISAFATPPPPPPLPLPPRPSFWRFIYYETNDPLTGSWDKLCTEGGSEGLCF